MKPKQLLAQSPEDKRIHILHPDAKPKTRSFWARCGKVMPRDYQTVPSMTGVAICQKCVRSQNEAFVLKRNV
jgi:hypothetical protein